MKKKVLLVDDDSGTRFGFVKYLSKAGYDMSEAKDLAGGRDALTSSTFDVIILDLILPDGKGLDFINDVRDVSPEIPIIMITAAGDIPIAVDAMRRGADNFLTKPVDMEGLAVFLKKTIEIGSLKKASSSRQRLEKKEGVYFGESPAMKKVYELAQIASESDTQILITGETGTGKGMLAKWIHVNSGRSANAFVDVNCSGLRSELLAREIFGNVRGAFTSADQDRQGLLDLADGGTFFLDEIGDMDVSLQAPFLKVLEEKNYRRLGDVKSRRSDFRLITATNKDLGQEIKDGTFRQDLLYRINLLMIHIPPLRERPEDIKGLIFHLLHALGKPQAEITGEALQILEAYLWPGNIRELRNVIERALLVARGSSLRPDHFVGLTALPSAVERSVISTLNEAKESHILTVLERFNGDAVKAARSLNISRATIYRKIKQLKENIR